MKGVNLLFVLCNVFFAYSHSLYAQQISGDTLACIESYKTYTFPSNSDYSYQWHVQGGSPIYSTSDSFDVIWTVNLSGVVSLYETDSTGFTNQYVLNVKLHNKPKTTIRTSWQSTCTELGTIQDEPTKGDGNGGFSIEKEFLERDCQIMCGQKPISFYTKRNPKSTYQWSVMGTSAFDTLAWTNDSIRIMWTEPGSGFVILTEINENGCEGFDGICYQIISKPEASFDIEFPSADSNGASVCAGQSIRFTNLSESIGFNEEISWFVNGDFVATGQNPQLDFNSSGSYEVSMILNDQCNCSDTAYASIEVSELAAADISCPGVLCEGNVETYSTNASCNPYSWSVIGSNNYSTNGSDITIEWNEVPNSGYGQIILDGNTCDSVCTAPSVIQVPIILAEAEILGSNLICLNGSQFSYSVPFWPGTGYQWAIINQPLGSDIQLFYENRNELVIDVRDAEAGTLKLRVEYFNELLGCGGFSEIEIDIKPKLEIIEDEPILCVKDTFSFMAMPDSSASPYTWSLLAINSDSLDGITILPETGPVLTYSIPYSGDYLILVENTDYCVPSGKWVNVRGIPPPPLSISGPDSICPGPGQYQTYTAQVSSADYYIEWVIEDGSPQSPRLDEGPSIEHIFLSTNPPFRVTAYQVNRENPACRSEGLVKEVWMNLPPDFEITGPDTVCANTTSYFSTDLVGQAIYNWTLPGGLGSLSGENSNQVEVQWNNINPLPDSIQIFLSAESCGFKRVKSKTIVIIAGPEPDIALDGDTCAGSTVNFTATGVNSGEFFWTLLPQGSAFPDQVSVSHQFATNAAGSYTMHLEVQNPNGCPVRKEAALSFNILPLPVANIGIDSGKVNYCVDTVNSINVYVRLVRSSQEVPGYEYQWTRNGSPITGTINQDTYVVDTSNFGIPLNQTGSVNYQLMVTDSATGCSNLSNPIQVKILPCEGACSSEPVILSHTIQRNCNIVEFSATMNNPQFQYGELYWNVNYPSGDIDYRYISNDTFVHEYEKSGIYQIYSKVDFYENDGSSITDSSTICFEDTLLRIVVPLIPEFGFNFACDSSNQMRVVFSDRSNFVAGYTSITATEWNIVDIDNSDTLIYNGNTARLPSTLPEGNYEVRIEQTFNYNDGIEIITGETCSFSDSIYVPGLPSVVFDNYDPEICEGNTVHFAATATGNITEWYWDYGDGSSSLIPDTTWYAYVYDEGKDFDDNQGVDGYNNYTAQLSVTDAYGCRAFDTVGIRVHQDNFHYHIEGDSLACVGEEIELYTDIFGDDPDEPNDDYDGISTLPASWLWNTGDTTSSIIVTQSGQYNVLMQDSFGCRDFATYAVHFTGLPAAKIKGSDYVCYGSRIELEAPQNVGSVSYTWQHSSDTLNGQWITVGTDDYLETQSGNWDAGVNWQAGIHHIRLIMQSNTAGGLLCPDTSDIYILKVLDALEQPIVKINYNCELPVEAIFDNIGQYPGANWNWSSGSVNKDSIGIAFTGIYKLEVLDTMGCSIQTVFEIETLPPIKNMGMECVQICDTALNSYPTLYTQIDAQHWGWIKDSNLISQGSGEAVLTIPPSTQSGIYNLVVWGIYNGEFCYDTTTYLDLEVITCCDDSIWGHLNFVEDTVCNNAIPLLEIGFNTDFAFMGIQVYGFTIALGEMSRTIIEEDPEAIYDAASGTYTLPAEIGQDELADTLLSIYIIPHNGDSIGNATCIGDTIWTDIYYETCTECDSLAMTPRVNYQYNNGILEVTDISISPYGHHVTEMWYNGVYYSGAPYSTAHFDMPDILSCDTLIMRISHYVDDICCYAYDTLNICIGCHDIVTGSQTDIYLDGCTWQMDYDMNYQPDYISWTFPDGSMQAGNLNADSSLMSASWSDPSCGGGGEVCITTSYKLGDQNQPCGSPWAWCCNVTYCFQLGLDPTQVCADLAQQLELEIDHTNPNPYVYTFSWGPDPIVSSINITGVEWAFGDGSNPHYNQDSVFIYEYLCPQDSMDTYYSGYSNISYVATAADGNTFNCQYNQSFLAYVPACPDFQAKLYPNPSSSEVFVAFHDIAVNQATYRVYNHIGKLMFVQEKVEQKVERIDIAPWANGIYLVHITGLEKSQTLRFIKK